MEPPPTFGVEIPPPPNLPLQHDHYEGLRFALLRIAEEIGDAPVIATIRSLSKVTRDLVDARFSVLARAERLCGGIISAVDPYNAGILRLVEDALFVYRANTATGKNLVNPSACLRLLRIHTLVKNASNYVYAPMRGPENQITMPNEPAQQAAHQWVALRIPRELITNKYPCVIENMNIIVYDRCNKCARLAMFDTKTETQLRWIECYKRRMVQLLSGYALQLFSKYTATVYGFVTALEENPQFLLSLPAPEAMRRAENCIKENYHLEAFVIYMSTGATKTYTGPGSWQAYAHAFASKGCTERSRVSADTVLEIPDQDYAVRAHPESVWSVLSLWNRAVFATGYWAFKRASVLVRGIKWMRRGGNYHGQITQGQAVVAAAVALQPPQTPGVTAAVHVGQANDDNDIV